MTTLIFRKRTTGFSIEKLFDALYVKLQAQKLDISRTELPHASSGIVSLVRNAWFVLRHTDDEVLHITGDVHYAALLRPATKTIITVHDCVTLRRGKGIKRFILWLLWFRIPLSFAARITVVSDQTRRELLKTVSLPEEKIVVIPAFVGDKFGFKPRRFNDARPRILHIGTTPNKNLPRAIAALRQIPCVLVIVGQIDESIAQQLKASGIEFEHHVGVDEATLIDLYRDADIVSFPSTYEGFGMPIIEGQTIGRAVLTSDMEPMRSVAGGGALLVDPHSANSIRDGFERLIADSALRERLIAAGRDNARQYTLEIIAARYQSLYASLHAP